MKYFFDNNIAKYGIKELRDGLTLENLKNKHSWILKTKIKDAILGVDNNGYLIWYSGIWKNLLWHLIKWYFSGLGINFKKWNLIRRTFNGNKSNIWWDGIYLDLIFEKNNLKNDK